MKLLLSVLILLQSSGSLLAESNWLLGGLWVDRNFPCPPRHIHGDIRPGGMKFSAAELEIFAPPVRPGAREAQFIARYDIEGTHIIAHLSRADGSVRLDLPFDALADGSIRDLNGYFYRRCALAGDEPVS